MCQFESASYIFIFPFSFNEEMDPPFFLSFQYLFTFSRIFCYCKEWSECWKPKGTVGGSAKKLWPSDNVILSTIRGQTDKKNWLQLFHWISKIDALSVWNPQEQSLFRFCVARSNWDNSFFPSPPWTGCKSIWSPMTQPSKNHVMHQKWMHESIGKRCANSAFLSNRYLPHPWV